MKEKIKNYFGNVFYGFGCFLNAVFGGKPIYSIFDSIGRALKEAKRRVLSFFNKG